VDIRGISRTDVERLTREAGRMHTRRFDAIVLVYILRP
jgi:hypothetical protein